MRQIRITLFLIAIFITSLTSAQDDLDKMLLKEIPNCEHVAYNSSQLVGKYFHSQDYDSINNICIKWEQFCGESEPLVRIKILNHIQLGAFSEELLPSNYALDMIFLYIDRVELSEKENYHQYYEYYKIPFGFIPLKSDFDLMTYSWAQSLLTNKDLSALEKALCLLYSNQFEDFWALVNSGQLTESEFAKTYSENVEQTKKMVDGNVGLVTGVYLPTGNLGKYIGPKPIIGVQCGFKASKLQYDLTIAIRNGNAKESYEVIYENQLITTDHHLGGFIGADVAYELSNNFKTEFDLIGGIAFDGFDVVEGDYENDIKGKSLNTFNFNIGLGYRIYTKRMNYLGFQARYNFVNHKNEGGTPLAGNHISILVTYNLFGNISKHHALKRMHLK